jgi:ADP-ribose pyrophosphatase
MTRTREDVRVEGVNELYAGAYRADCFSLRHLRFDGSWSHSMQREVFDRGEAVAVLPYNPDRDEVVLIEQFRAGPYAAGGDPWVLEIVAGSRKEDERPEDVACRECMEETGLEAGSLEQIAAYYVSPGSISEFIYLFVARVDARGGGGLHGLAHEGEDIRGHVWPAEKAIAAVASGRVQTGPAVAALWWLAAHRPALRERWLVGHS